MHDRTQAAGMDTIRQGYVPAIDGLRFFAVGSVMLFHLDRSLLPGGFVGVDVFFVISGYLITGILTNPAHPLGLMRFYQNRIARIAPASLLTVVATLAAGFLVYDEQTFAYLGSAATFAAASAINLKLLMQSSYFAASPIGQPLLHFWSLAVEEQFYLIYPGALLLLSRAGGGPRTLALAIAGVGLASFLLSLVLTWQMPVWAFYLLPTRAWELCAGGWLALRTGSHRWQGGLGWVGLGLLLVAFAAVSEGRPFPGWQALLPVAATMLMLDATRVHCGFARALAAPPLVWVGLRSYSLYLWHWPVYSLVDYALWQDGWGLRLALKVGLTLALAMGSYDLVERPLRGRLRAPGARRLAFAGFFAAVAAIAATGVLVRNHYYLSAEGRVLDRGGYLVGAAGGARVVSLGDSEAAMYGTMLRDLAGQGRWRLRLLAAAGTNELPDEPGTRWPGVVSWLERDRPRVAILAYAWRTKLGDGAALDRALERLAGLGARVVIVLQPPAPADRDFDPRLAGAATMPEVDRAGREATAAAIRAIAARHPGTQVIDPSALFLDGQGRVMIAGPGGTTLYFDQVHLSRDGADRVAPLLDAAVARAMVARR